ncbi:MAG: aldo/keto reductase [Planctomycetota bacterium]
MSEPARIVLGLWPIAGITTVGVTREDAKATIGRAIDAGIRQFDTAYSYGFDGESDRLLGEFVVHQRDEFHIMGKVGQRWTTDRQRYVDGSPQQLTLDAEESLRRLGIDAFDVLFLHSIDPKVPIEVSANAMAELQRRGLCRQIGVCNVTANQLGEFNHAVACRAIQCPLNLVQPDSTGLIESARAIEAEVYVFWTLMKGLLAGRIGRDHEFAEGDSRPSYPIFQGELRASIHDMIDAMRRVGQRTSRTVAQLSVGWAVSQPGVQAALVGARRPEQIEELAATTSLDSETIDELESLATDAIKKLT